ncbi:hypothetical protein [Streptomyces sp. NPDC059015]|uniref:hypothetical protein n=1 Tax=unclassified Streptomyces TaxID=2593676 RepID=UPI0036912DCC
MRDECDEFAVTLAGQILGLGPVLFFHPRVTTTTPSRPPPSMPDAATARSSPRGPPMKRNTSGSNGNPLRPATNASPHRRHYPAPPNPAVVPGLSQGAMCVPVMP